MVEKNEKISKQKSQELINPWAPAESGLKKK